MARKESVTGAPDPTGDEKAPWETGPQDQAAPGVSEASRVARAVVEQTAEVAADRIEADLASIVRPGSGAGASARQELAERLSRSTPARPDITQYGPAMQRLVVGLAEQVDAAAANKLQVFEDVAARIESASTVDDVLASDAPLDAEQILGVTLQLWGVSVNESDYVDGLPAYVALRAIRQDSMDNVVVTCGGFKVVAKALKLQRINQFPVMVKIVQSDRKTRAGYDVLDMVKP